MKNYILLVLIITSFKAVGFEAFDQEAKFISDTLDCKIDKTTPGDRTWGALYSCVAGGAEVVKIFINEKPGENKVKNIKLMWNDWTDDIGYGVHTDKKVAYSWFSKVLERYAPRTKESIMKAFSENKNRSFHSDQYYVEYTYSKGPKIDERLILISQK